MAPPMAVSTCITSRHHVDIVPIEAEVTQFQLHSLISIRWEHLQRCYTWWWPIIWNITMMSINYDVHVLKSKEMIMSRNKFPFRCCIGRDWNGSLYPSRTRILFKKNLSTSTQFKEHSKCKNTNPFYLQKLWQNHNFPLALHGLLSWSANWVMVPHSHHGPSDKIDYRDVIAIPWQYPLWSFV